MIVSHHSSLVGFGVCGPRRRRLSSVTSIWSFVVRTSMELFLLRKANDDRRLSIGASQARHKDCRASRPLIIMAKVGIRHEALFATGLPNRDIPHRAMSIERLEPCEVKLSPHGSEGGLSG